VISQARFRSPLTIVAVTMLAAAAGATGVAAASMAGATAAPGAAATVAADPGTATAIPGFLIQSSSKVSDDAAVSRPGYSTTGWYPVGPRSTVLAGLLANGKYADPLYSTNMKSIPASDFSVPWWYRADLDLADVSSRTYLDFSGVLSRADVWINGTRVATSTDVAGAYTRHELDVTAQVHTGTNSVALKVYPNDPNKDLTMGWIDWLQPPPDKNMGIVRDIVVRRGGQVALRNAHVVTKLTVPALDRADLTVKADARNDSGSAVHATIAGTVAGRAVSQDVDLAAHETRTVTFGVVTLTNPQVWWPAGMGGQPLYDLDLTASVSGSTSDTAHERFGVRDVQAPVNSSGGRAYKINGRPLLIKGGGWSPDIFLRWNPTYVEDKIRYTRDLGLNTIRLEGHIEPDEFFDLTDRYGILTLPGWECCDKWEGQVNGGEPGDTWTTTDYPIAKASMAAEAARLRDHPSVISFLIGSDFAPNSTIEKNYVDALKAADWSLPIVPAASDNSAPITGASGMKMTGPYDYVPPNYWYDKHSGGGGAFGFNSETSAGPDMPTVDTLKRMMSSSELDSLWKNPNTAQYHRSPSSTFNTLKIFDNAMSKRYGAPASLDDYVRKAQLAQYENVRAQYEAYGRNFTDSSNPATGVIYWMLNSGWTSLHWQLFDYYLDQNGSYYGAKKANEPVHVQYSYDNKSVVVTNASHAAANGLTVRVVLYNIDGTEKFNQTAGNLSVPGDGGRTTALTVPAVSGLSTTYLAKLTLSDAGGKEVSRNVYWLSTKADVVDWSKNDWYWAPQSAYADLTGLSGMAQAPVTAGASSVTGSDGTTTTTVTLKNTGSGKIPALLVDAHVLGASGTPALPIQWTDNEVSLWPGESTTLTATYRTADLKGAAPSVRVSGWNVATQTIPAGDGGGGGDHQAPSVPGNLHATAVTTGSVALAWDASTDDVGVTGYDVLRDGTVVGSATTTSYTDGTVAPATSYTYAVRAKDAAGNMSAASAPVPVTTPPGGGGCGPATLLSQGKPATASSVESSSLPASNAVDGKTNTRWGSKEGSDPQWISVDLGTRSTLSQVKLLWEAAYGKAYRIEVSDDGAAWTPVYSTTTGNGGTDDLTVSGSGRYVRMYGTKRGTSYGYSLFEFQVSGTTC
jgi:exo-1,4-beta-D-glucosaminidase